MSDWQESQTFVPTPEIIRAVNAAIYLRRPLLVTGPPGSGKSSIADSVAYELGLGPVLRWHVTSHSTLEEAYTGMMPSADSRTTSSTRATTTSLSFCAWARWERRCSAPGRPGCC